MLRHGFSEVWKSWHEPTGGGLANAEVLHHLAKPRLCGGPAHSAGAGTGKWGENP